MNIGPRDYFAGIALRVIMEKREPGAHKEEKNRADTAKWAYEIAEAMLKASRST